MASGEEDDDQRLLARARRDPDAFGLFYRRHVDDLLRYCHRRTRDPDIAADLVAEAFALALEQLDGYDPDRGVPRQWLFGIVNNLLRRYWRRQRVDARARQRLGIGPVPLDEETAAALESIDDAGQVAEILAAIDALPHRLRDAVRLRIVDGHDYDDIADRLDITPGNARVRVFRGLRQLQVVLT